MISAYPGQNYFGQFYSTAAGVTAGIASGTGTAYNALGNAPVVDAGIASGTGSAYNASRLAPAELAAGTGSAANAAVSIVLVPIAGAYQLTIDDDAGEPITDETGAPLLGEAFVSGIGQAFQAAANTPSGSTASATLAAGIGTGRDASPALFPRADVSTGTGSAYTIVRVTVVTRARLATGTGQAFVVPHHTKPFLATVSSGLTRRATVSIG